MNGLIETLKSVDERLRSQYNPQGSIFNDPEAKWRLSVTNCVQKVETKLFRRLSLVRQGGQPLPDKNVSFVIT